MHSGATANAMQANNTPSLYPFQLLSLFCPPAPLLGNHRPEQWGYLVFLPQGQDPQQQPAAEWERFGAYCFLLPQLEFLEAAECCLLACTVAWDRDAAASSGVSELEQDPEPSPCAPPPRFLYACRDAARTHYETEE